MPHPRFDELVARLPKEVAEQVHRSQHPAPNRPADRSNFMGQAAQLLGFQDGPLYLLPSELSPAQKALAEIAAYEDDYNGYGGMPGTAEARRRWLGLAPPGILEQPVRPGEADPCGMRCRWPIRASRLRCGRRGSWRCCGRCRWRRASPSSWRGPATTT